MRSAIVVITVSTVARDHPPAGPLRPHLPAAISRRQWPASAVLAVCTALVALAVTAGPDPHQRAPQFLLVGVACSPIALLRRWPLTVLAAATVVKALVMTRGIASLPFAIVLGFASYCAASRLPRRVSITAVAASAAILGGALLYATFAVRRISPAAEAIEAFLPLAAAWFIGDSVAARRRYLAGLAEQAERERAAEAELARQQVREERVRIARELHDVVVHTLTVITVQAGVGRRLMVRRPEKASTALESIACASAWEWPRACSVTRSC